MGVYRGNSLNSNYKYFSIKKNKQYTKMQVFFLFTISPFHKDFIGIIIGNKSFCLWSLDFSNAFMGSKTTYNFSILPKLNVTVESLNLVFRRLWLSL